MTITERLIACIVGNFNLYDYPFWNPDKVKDACSEIDSKVADRLNYSNAESLALSIGKQCNEDITKYIIKHMYPVWVTPNDPDPKPKHKNLLITYNYTGLKLKHLHNLIKREEIDLVILEGKTQGWIGQEIFRVQKFAKCYDKTLFMDCQMFYEKDILSLYELDCDNAIAVPIKDIETDEAYMEQRLQLLKAEGLQRFFALDSTITNALRYENSILPTINNRLILCSKSTSDIWQPIQFPFPQTMGDEKIWMELNIARKQYEVNKIAVEQYEEKHIRKYVTNNDLLESTMESIPKIPEIKAVIGMPRSGMYTAGIIADQKNVPLISMSDKINEHIVNAEMKNAGFLKRYLGFKSKLPILFVDDTIYTGMSMSNIRKQLLQKNPDENFLFFTNYSSPKQRDKADILGGILAEPHLLQWNLFNSTLTSRIMFDIDGILSPDVPIGISENEEYYIEYIQSVKPIISNLPRLFHCAGLCTGRLEMYRDMTEQWLRKHGVKYEKLIMFDRTKEERDSNHNMVVGLFKAEKIRQSKVNVFVESDDQQAQIITRDLTRRNVSCNIVCMESKKLYTSYKNE